MPPKRNTKGKKAAAGKKEGTTDDLPAGTKVKNLTAKIFMIDESLVEKKNRLKVIDSKQLDQDTEVEKAEYKLEKASYEKELEDLDEEDPTFEARASRIRRHLARSSKNHDTRLEELFDKMTLERESLDEEAETLNKEVENLRILRKKTAKELADAEKELRGDSSETQSSESSD